MWSGRIFSFTAFAAHLLAASAIVKFHVISTAEFSWAYGMYQLPFLPEFDDFLVARVEILLELEFLSIALGKLGEVPVVDLGILRGLESWHASESRMFKENCCQRVSF